MKVKIFDLTVENERLKEGIANLQKQVSVLKKLGPHPDDSEAVKLIKKQGWATIHYENYLMNLNISRTKEWKEAIDKIPKRIIHP